MRSLIGRRRPVRSGSNPTSGEKIGAATRGLAARISFSVIMSFGLLVVIAGLFFWYEKFYASPERTFWAMVANSLSTYGVTKETHQERGSTLNDQLSQLVFVPEPRVREIQRYSTGSSKTPARITVETISTPTDSYRHYLLIDRPAQNGQKKLDYSPVYPMWLKSSVNEQTRASLLFGNTIFGGVLFGDLSIVDREAVLKLLNDVYRIDFAHVKQQSQGGRRVYSYNVEIKLHNYAKAASRYAHSLDLPYAGQIDAKKYPVTQKIKATIAVDVLAREIRQISYQASKITENYSGYGIRADMPLPKQTVTYQELQNTLNAIK